MDTCGARRLLLFPLLTPKLPPAHRELRRWRRGRAWPGNALCAAEAGGGWEASSRTTFLSSCRFSRETCEIICRMNLERTNCWRSFWIWEDGQRHVSLVTLVANIYGTVRSHRKSWRMLKGCRRIWR
ncbi:hypothetical protein BDA96_08G077900 [Sorghum bicolor]|uniref:Uncharacterized protein n=1 Tax=Sorghum bicolor TaxID=4558 RepID=A0A921U7A8_SORBI|nr:hypothetical protein BDA96_08G077900 [Sorghum bicolor]